MFVQTMFMDDTDNGRLMSAWIFVAICAMNSKAVNVIVLN